MLPFEWIRLPWSPSTWRVPGRRREAFLMLDKGISWAETLSLGAWAPGRRRTKRFPSRVSVFLYRFTRMQPLGLAWREVGRRREAFLMLDKGISWVETLSLHGRSDETRWGNLHTFQGAGALFVLAGGCERAGDQMKQDGATIHAFTSSMLRQTNFSCVSTYICKPSILLAFVTHAFHILQPETNTVPCGLECMQVTPSRLASMVRS